jgi:C-terminal processing protease CtpA/Prc
MLYLASCQGLILDVRSNGGGELKQAQKLAARFCDSKTFVGYMRHKTGPGHDDFSDFEEQYIEPTANIRWHKPVCVLTNRSTYSAANEFVKYMKTMPAVTVVGDNTGGGAGMPYSAELPNGWAVRFSACPMYDVNRKSTENGIEPDVKTDINEEDALKGLDTIVEAARKLLSSTK